MKICIGICSYLPDDKIVRQERLQKLSNLLIQCNYIFGIDIIIIAQNWGKLSLSNFKSNSNIYVHNYKSKLGIIGARKELRKKFLESDYDYLVMLDDDCKLVGTKDMGIVYLDQLRSHKDMWAWYKKNLLKLFAISRKVFSEIDYPDGSVENGDYLEDLYLCSALQLLFPTKQFKFLNVGLTEISDSARDANSTWFKGQYDKHEIGDRTRLMISNLKKSLRSSTNVFYFDRLNCVGGVESFFYYIAKTYGKKYDITFYYGKDSDINQINRLKKYCDCFPYYGTKLKCKRLFVQYGGFDQILDNTDAEEYIEVIHADYTNINFHKPYSKITKYIAVSNLARDAFIKKTGLECDTFYIPVVKQEVEPCLNLISATRLRDPQKGKWRMKILADRLEERNIPFIWTVFTDDTNELKNKHISYMTPELDILPYIKNSDFLVQLSDRESYCLSIVESLLIGTPVIITDLPVKNEIGINETNSIICNFDMLNVDEVIDKMISFKKDKIEYKLKKSSWGKLLND